jgi:Tfp pilus assembly protein PilO
VDIAKLKDIQLKDIKLDDILLKLQNKIVPVIFICFALLTIIIARKVIYIPQRHKISSIKQELEKVREKLELIKKIDELQASIATYQLKIPAGGDVSWLIDELTRAAKQSDINVLSIDPLASQEQDIFWKHLLRMRLEAGYHQLGEFLSTVESLESFVKIDSLQMGIEDDSGSQKQVSATKVSLLISTVSLKE